jgi:hypothetical protein
MNRERYLTEIGQSTGSEPRDGLAAGFLREGYGWAWVRGGDGNDGEPPWVRGDGND